MMALPAETVEHLLGELLDDDGRARLGRGEAVTTIHLRGAERYGVRIRREPEGICGEIDVLPATPAAPPPQPVAPLARVAPAAATAPASASPGPMASDEALAGHVPQGFAERLAELLAPMLGEMAERGASDLHLAPGDEPRLRLDGVLVRSRAGDSGRTEIEHELGAALAGHPALDLALTVPGVGRFRVHGFAQMRGPALAVRRLPESVPDLASLGLGRELEALVAQPNGLVLVVGATGSGKSTTLAALAARALARRPIHVVTLEDPVEYLLPAGQGLVQQRAVGEQVPSFAAGLATALREDPDLLVVGELRDAQTIDLALRAAETGHLVLATLHSGSTVGAVRRLVDAFAADRRSGVRSQVADTLRAVVAQRLLPRVGGGRVVAIELLRLSYAAQALIREDKVHQLGQVLETGQDTGSYPLERSLVALERSGAITAETADAAAQSPDLLRAFRARR
jgi:twitching motility protein PilT